MQNEFRILPTLLSLGVIAGLGLIGSPAAAQVDTSGWSCEFCPFPAGYQADVEVGASYVSDDAFRFGDASGYDEKGAYPIVAGEGQYNKDGYRLNWYAEDLGLDSRVFEMDGGHQGKYGFYLGYSELPHRVFDSTSTVFTASAGDRLVLPAGWVTASLTSGFTALDASLRPVSIQSDRKTLTAGADFLPARNFTVSVDYRHQTRDGIDIVSGANFIQAALLPRRLDFETDTVDASLDYAKGPLSLSLAWYGSFFKNNLKSLTWDNPFTPFPGADQGRLAQEPDNDFQQLALSGSYAAESIHSVIAFSAAMGRGEQTEQLLPYTINPTIVAGALPRTNLDGKVDTTSYAVTVTSRPFAKAGLKLAYRYDERDNQTPRDTWERVVVDGFLAPDTEENTPYSFKRGRLSVSGDYRLLDRLHVSAGYDRTELDRDFQEVAEQTEDSGWGKIRLSVTEWLDLSAKGGAARREIDRYDTTIAESFGQNPLLRKYHLAHRYREFGELNLSLAPVEKPFSIGLSARYADDDYSKSALGLTSGRDLHVSADFNYTVSEKTSVYLLGGYESIEAEQLGSASFSTPTWQASHEDDFDHYGAGLQLRQLGDKTDLSIDYLYSNGETSIDLRENGTNSPFPDLESELQSLRLKVRYRRSEKLDLDFSLRYESFSTRDWALDGVDPDTIATVLTLGADAYDYSVWVAGMSFRYMIGNR